MAGYAGSGSDANLAIIVGSTVGAAIAVLVVTAVVCIILLCSKCRSRKRDREHN